MSVTPLPFSEFVDTTDSEQRWQIFNAIQGQTGLAENVTIVGPVDGSGNVKVNLANSLPFGTNNIGSVNPDNSPATGSLSASSNTYTVTTSNYSTLAFQAVKSGTITGGTISIYGSIDGTTFSVLTTYVSLTTGNSSSSFSATNSVTAGQINTTGLKAIQFSGGSTITGGGSLAFIVNQSVATSNVMLDNALPSGQNAIGYISSPSGFTAGQQAVTASAAALPSASLTTGIVLTNGSSATVYIGGSSVSSSTGYALSSGSSIGLVVAQLSSIYIIGTASSGNLSYIGS